MSARIVTVPNLITFTRLLTVPVFWWAILTDRFILATIIVAVVGSTDWLDGYLARLLDQVSELGRFLDPLADRLMIASAVIGGSMTGVIPGAFAYPLIAREVLVGAGAALLAKRMGKAPSVRFRGKLATFLVYVAVPAFYLARATEMETVFSSIAWLIGIPGLFLYWWVALEYAGDARRALSIKEDTARLG